MIGSGIGIAGNVISLGQDKGLLFLIYGIQAIIVDIVILYYLYRPHIRSYFDTSKDNSTSSSYKN